MGMSTTSKRNYYYINTYNPTQSLHLTSTISPQPPRPKSPKQLLIYSYHSTEKTMITPKRLIAMAKKWQKKAAITRRRISYPTTAAGYFVMYTADQKRFVVPLEYLKNNIFIELFRMSEEEFGLPGNGPITLPFDGVFIEYVISFLTGRRSISENIEKALLIGLLGGTTIDHRCSSKSFALSQQQQSSHQLFLQGF